MDMRQNLPLRHEGTDDVYQRQNLVGGDGGPSDSLVAND